MSRLTNRTSSLTSRGRCPTSCPERTDASRSPRYPAPSTPSTPTAPCLPRAAQLSSATRPPATRPRRWGPMHVPPRGAVGSPALPVLQVGHTALASPGCGPSGHDRQPPQTGPSAGSAGTQYPEAWTGGQEAGRQVTCEPAEVMHSVHQHLRRWSVQQEDLTAQPWFTANVRRRGRPAAAPRGSPRRPQGVNVCVRRDSSDHHAWAGSRRSHSGTVLQLFQTTTGDAQRRDGLPTTDTRWRRPARPTQPGAAPHWDALTSWGASACSSSGFSESA